MPSAIVHLKAAFDLKDKLDVKNIGQFYMGAVSPDAVNIDGFADQSVRYPAHLRSLDYEEWKATARAFCKENKARYAEAEDFLKGFLLHIFTDIYWDELAQPILFEQLQANGAKPEELRDLKWKELYRFNYYLQGDWLYDEVMPAIRKTKPIAIGTVTEELLGRYLDHLTGEYMKERAIAEPPKICSTEMIEQVEEACLKEFKALY